MPSHFATSVATSGGTVTYLGYFVDTKLNLEFNIVKIRNLNSDKITVQTMLNELNALFEYKT